MLLVKEIFLLGQSRDYFAIDTIVPREDEWIVESLSPNSSQLILKKNQLFKKDRLDEI